MSQLTTMQMRSLEYLVDLVDVEQRKSPILGRTDNVLIWETKVPIETKWRLIDGSEGSRLVPKGFQTDLASIPRALWIFFTPWDLGIVAAISHDYDYRLETFADVDKERRGKLAAMVSRARKLADQAYFMALLQSGNVRAARLFYYAVRGAGWQTWASHTVESVKKERERCELLKSSGSLTVSLK